uniref:Uncharacterized protein n=1 Tax=Anguilla anguilla TaxID=7936 RepID=A0A0E9TUC6_ANGAN
MISIERRRLAFKLKIKKEDPYGILWPCWALASHIWLCVLVSLQR